MDQINYTMLNMLRGLGKMQEAAKPAARDSRTGRSRFEELMKRQAEAEGAAAGSAAGTTEEAETAETAGPAQEVQESVWLEQMELAAMSVVSVPVIPVQIQEADAPEQTPEAGPGVQLDLVAAAAAPQVEESGERKLPAELTDIGAERIGEAAAEETVPGDAVQTDGARAEQGDESGVQQEGEAEIVELPQQSLFQELRAVPIKVGETSAAQRSEQLKGMEKQLLGPLSKAIERGDTKVEIRLKPAYLGTVKVELTRGADGSLQVLLSAENPRTQALLDKHAADLQSTLFDQTQEPVRVEVRQPEETQRGNDYQQDGRQGGRQQERQHREQSQDGRDFLQQLRLGLLPLDAEIVT